MADTPERGKTLRSLNQSEASSTLSLSGFPAPSLNPLPLLFSPRLTTAAWQRTSVLQQQRIRLELFRVPPEEPGMSLSPTICTECSELRHLLLCSEETRKSTLKNKPHLQSNLYWGMLNRTFSKTHSPLCYFYFLVVGWKMENKQLNRRRINDRDDPVTVHEL